MKCKPGDLAIIVWSDIQQNIGALLRVVEPGDRAGWWSVEPLSSGLLCYYRDTKKVGPLRPGRPKYIQDKCLRPIRDPGDDAQDEMLRPLPHEVTVCQ